MLFRSPSLYEGLGMVLIEAQCSGLPCVCSSEVPKVAKVQTNVTFIDLNEDIKVWSKSILKKQTRKYDDKKISKRGYSTDKEVKKLEEIYINYSK